MISILLVGLSVITAAGGKIEAKQVTVPHISIAKQQSASALCEKVWVAGHYETRYRQVWVNGYHNEVWVEPTYLTAPDGQQIFWNSGYWKKIYVPGHYEVRPFQVWVPGAWVLR